MFLNLKQASKYLQMSSQTLTRICERGEITYYRKDGYRTKFRFQESDLIAYMNQYKKEKKTEFAENITT